MHLRDVAEESGPGLNTPALKSYSAIQLAMTIGGGLMMILCLFVVGGYLLKPQGPSWMGTICIVASYVVLRLLWTTLVHLTKDTPFDPKLLILNVNLQKMLFSFILWLTVDGTSHDLLKAVISSPREILACAVPA